MGQRILAALVVLLAFAVSAAHATEPYVPEGYFPGATFVVPKTWTSREDESGVLYFDSPGHKAVVSFVIVREKLPPGMAEGTSLSMSEDGRPAPAISTTISGLKAFKFITAKELWGETQWLTTIAILIDEQHLGLCHVTTYDSTPPEIKAEADAIAASIRIQPGTPAPSVTP